jgi:hypothetical protein
MTHARVLSLNMLTAASLMLPLAVAVLQAQSPLHMASTRIWVRYDWDLNVDVPDGSGFRTVISVPGLLALFLFLTFPFLWIRRQWGQAENPHAFLTTLLLSLIVAWLPLVMVIHGSDDAEGRIYVAFSSFVAFSVGAGISGICPECGLPARSSR